MLKNKRLLILPVLSVVLSGFFLGLRFGYPYHRLIAFFLLFSAWIPLVISYQQNRRLLRVAKRRVKQKVMPYFPHIVVALLLTVALYCTWVLVPIIHSPLTGMTTEQLRQEIDEDLGSYRMLRNATDDIVGRFKASGLLGRKVSELSEEEREAIRSLWREGIAIFFEFDLLKEKYRGFYQLDYVAEPALHADAFFLAYAAYITQYQGGLDVFHMVGDNAFMEVLLDEPGEGIHKDGFFKLKQRLVDPRVTLRLNAGSLYYTLVKKDITVDEALVHDFETRHKVFFKKLAKDPELYIKNPLDILEHRAFESWFPVQKKVAVQMSYIRTAQRDYLITVDQLARYRNRFQPGDILLQRRNWHITNIGIPGFWPHVALYVGTPSELESFFSELGTEAMTKLKALHPGVLEQLAGVDEEGFPYAVVEAIRPGVVIQSLEKSSHCDYLAVVRPALSKAEKFEVIMNAFSQIGKPYDLNFDFATDNELVCSELVYKSYKPLEKLPFDVEVVSGRLLLPPNRMAEQIVHNMQSQEPLFDLVLFLDAIESTDQIREGSMEDFCVSCARPKWDFLQK